MPRLSWLTALSSICFSSTAASMTGDTSIFEIDIISPRANVTYDYAPTFPVVYAFQNLRAALDVGDFTFQWELSPEEYETSFQRWSVDVTSDNIDQFVTSDGSPFLLINDTWSYPVNVGFDLQTGHSYTFWLTTSLWYNGGCANGFSDQLPLNVVVPAKLGDAPSHGEIDPGSIGNVTGNCPYVAVVADGPIATAASQCSMYQPSSTPTANPCAARLDAAQVSSVSSAASALLATPTETAGQPTGSTTSSGNVAMATTVPCGSAMLVAGILGVLGFGL